MNITNRGGVRSAIEVGEFAEEQKLMEEIKKEIVQVLMKHNLKIHQAKSILDRCKSDISERLDGLLFNDCF